MRSGCRGQLRWSPLLLGFMGLFLAACEAPPLAVTFGGCPYLRANSVCEVNYGIDGQLEELRLLVKTSPQADITVFQGRKSLPARIERTDLGRLVRVRPLPGVSGLTIVARKGIAWRRQDLVVREWTASDWVQKAFDTWAYRGNPEAAKRDLQERLEREPPRFDDEAWARGFLARNLTPYRLLGPEKNRSQTVIGIISKFRSMPVPNQKMRVLSDGSKGA